MITLWNVQKHVEMLFGHFLSFLGFNWQKENSAYKLFWIWAYNKFNKNRYTIFEKNKTISLGFIASISVRLKKTYNERYDIQPQEGVKQLLKHFKCF